MVYFTQEFFALLAYHSGIDSVFDDSPQKNIRIGPLHEFAVRNHFSIRMNEHHQFYYRIQGKALLEFLKKFEKEIILIALQLESVKS